MKNSPKIWTALPVLILSLAGCAAGGISQGQTQLTAQQCTDLTALRNNAPPNAQQNGSELAALRSAGYDPSRWFDPYYPPPASE